MKMNKVALLLLSSVFVTPAAFAETPNFNYVSGGYLNADFDGDDLNGWTLDGSKLLGRVDLS